MCGIAGFISKKSLRQEQLCSTATHMSDAITARGPDAKGVWSDPEFGIALSHRRLSIVDLSEAGSQPMTSACGRFVMIYNGEVYNASELRKELVDRIQFRGTSDTEVIIEGIARWGVEQTVSRLVGMFALALWDRSEKQLKLVRDRLGIKPIYWASTATSFLFGSEIKALKQHPDCPKELDHQAIKNYLLKSYINSPRSIYRGIQKLEPGTILTLPHNSAPRSDRYWSVRNVTTHGAGNIDERTDLELTDALHELLSDAVNIRMISDVPLGAFLSGGIDSSTVVALMQSNSNCPVKTFSIGFEEKHYNEAPHAAQIANHLGTDHHELYVTARDALDAIPEMSSIFDEPFGDISQIPTYLVSKMTRKHVTVALSGDGGDELFAGYERYAAMQRYMQYLKQPKFLRMAQAKALDSLTPAITKQLQRLTPERFGKLLTNENRQKIAAILRDGNVLNLYKLFIWHLENTDNVLRKNITTDDPVWSQTQQDIFSNDSFSLFQFIDMQDYLPDDILTKVDRTSMAVSLEARVPILDHRVVEFAMTLPQHVKYRDDQGKWILKQVLERHVPSNLYDRPKMGFGVPIGEWITGPLQPWAEELLSKRTLDQLGIFQTETILNRWKEHKDGTRNWQYHLWDVLMLQDWLSKHEHSV